jgi:hypothetical protein
MSRPRLIALAAALLALLAMPLLAACGDEESLDVKEGEPVTVDDFEYNVVISRFLNPDDTEDGDYLVGQRPLQGDELYLGIFMTVANDGDADASLPRDFTVVDTQGKEYAPLDSSSAYALPLGATVAPGEEYPIPDSTAAVGPIEGAMVLFRITQASTEDRPLELEIHSNTGEDGRVELDI